MKIDVAQFSDVVRLIHEAGVTPESWETALAAILDLFAGSRASLMDIASGTDELVGLAQVGHDPAHAKLYAEHYFRVDPTRLVALSAPPLIPMTGYEQFPKSLRGKHEYFDFAERVCNIGDVLGVSTGDVMHRQRAILSLQRTTDGPAYGPEEKTLLALLATHIQLAKQVQATLGAAWSAKCEAEAALSRLTVPALIVDAQRRIRHANAAAISLFGRVRQVRVQNGKLIFAESRVDASFQAAIRGAACEGGRSACIGIQLSSNLRADVLISPLDPSYGAASAWQMPLALIVIDAGERDAKMIATRMERLYDLTPTEGRVAADLAVGRSVEEIAKSNRVTDATLRSQLQSIYRKTGARRQAEVVRLALRCTFIAGDL